MAGAFLRQEPHKIFGWRRPVAKQRLCRSKHTEVPSRVLFSLVQTDQSKLFLVI